MTVGILNIQVESNRGGIVNPCESATEVPLIQSTPVFNSPYKRTVVDPEHFVSVTFRTFAAVSPTYDDVIQMFLRVRRRVKKPGALGRTQSLVAVSAVKITFKGIQVRRDHARRVGAVHGDHRAASMGEPG